MSTHSPSKREFIKKAAYAAPVVLSLQAYSALAKAGSGNYESPPPRSEEERQARCPEGGPLRSGQQAPGALRSAAERLLLTSTAVGCIF